jgi:hypothetical protein
MNVRLKSPFKGRDISEATFPAPKMYRIELRYQFDERFCSNMALVRAASRGSSLRKKQVQRRSI